MSAMIVLDKLTKKFGKLVAVSGVTLTVDQGEVLAFLGPNGAGKSTTMKMVTGFLLPTDGSAIVCGFDIVVQPLAAKAKLGYLPEGAPAYNEMTPLGFLSFVAAVRGYSGLEKTKRITHVVEQVALNEVLHQPIDTLSKGFRQRVSLAQALLHEPDVLILDEPTDGLDPNQKHYLRCLIRTMAHNKAIIISTHILEEVEAVCNRAVIIAHGHLLADGTAEDLLARMPGHNAVTITVTIDSAEETERQLRQLSDVADIERCSIDQQSNTIRLRALAKNGRPIASAVTKAIAPTIPLELTVEHSRLDDVFRALTI